MRKKKPAAFPKKMAFPILLFLFAFLLRLIYLKQISAHSPFFHVPVMDAELYYSRAKEIAGGNWLGSEVFWASPLYSYFLGTVLRLFGENHFVVRLIQSLIGSLSCLLIYFLGKRVFSHAVGIVAGFLAAVYGMFIFYDSNLLPAFLGVFLNLAAVIFILRANDCPGFLRYFLAGICCGLAGLARPNILLFVPLFALCLVLAMRPRGTVFTARNILGFILGAILMIIPVTVRNYFVGGDFVLISSQGGLNFYIGNHPGADGTYRRIAGISDVPGQQIKDSRRLAEEMTGRKLRPSEVSDWWYWRGSHFIKKNPARWVRLTARKFALFWKREEVDPQMNYYFFRRFSSLLRLPLPSFALISPLALTGIILSLKKRRKAGILCLFVFSYLATLLLFYVSARYRLPVVPLLIVFASYALWELISAVRTRKFRFAVFFILFFGLITLLTAFPLVKQDFGHSHYQLGYAFEENNLPGKAVEEYLKAIEIRPDLLEPYNNLGMLYAASGQKDEALEYYRKSLELNPARVEVYCNLGNLYNNSGMLREAAVEYQKALNIDPDFAGSYANLGVIYEKTGKTEEAVEYYKKALSLDPELLVTRLNLAHLYYAVNRLDEAEMEFRKVLRIDENNTDAQHYLEIIRSRKKSREESGEARKH